MCNVPAVLTSLSSSDTIAVLAGLIALLAMGATFWQAAISRNHNRLSVRPHLDFITTRFFGKSVSVTLTNNGLGPAIVRSAYITLDKDEYRLPDPNIPEPIYNEILATGLILQFNLLGPNTPISSGGSVCLVTVNGDLNNASIFNSAIAVVKRISFRFEYESMYEEKFSASSSLPQQTIYFAVKGDAAKSRGAPYLER